VSAPTVHVVGRLTAAPELRFTASGAAVASFHIAASDRRKTAAGEWEDGDPCFLRCTVWRETAEHVAESLDKGTEVVVVGKLRTRTWETKAGEKRSVIECDVEAIGPSLRWGVAKVIRAQRHGASAPASDPWATGGAESGASRGRGATSDPWSVSVEGPANPGPQRGAQWPDDEPAF